MMFAYAAGPLAWSIVAFRNSLVFHSLDKVLPDGMQNPDQFVRNSLCSRVLCAS